MYNKKIFEMYEKTDMVNLINKLLKADAFNFKLEKLKCKSVLGNTYEE